MVQISYPGVYIQEVPSGVHTITGVATSIAAFFGRASKGPMNKAIRILSLSDYKRQFGNPHPHSDLANSVMLFFANGGTDCYVIRLAKDAIKASVTLRSLVGQDVLVATAKAEGVWANTVRLEVDYKTPYPDETFNLRVVPEGGVAVLTESFINLSMNPTSPRFAPTFVTQSSELIDLILTPAMGDPALPDSFINTLANSDPGFSQGRRPLGAAGADVKATLDGLINPASPEIQKARFDISVNDNPFVTIDLRGAAVPATVPEIQNFIRDKIIDALSTISPGATVDVTLPNVPSVGRLLTITSDSGNMLSVRVRRASSNDIAAALMLGTNQSGIEAMRWSNFRPAPTATLLVFGSPGTLGDLANLNGIAALRQDAFNKITINGKDVMLNAAPNSIVTTAGTDPWFKNAPVPGAVNGDNDGVREKLRIIAAAINGTAGLPWKAEVWGYHLALLAKNGTPNEQPTTITTTPTTATFDNSLIKNVRQYSLGTSGTGSFSTGGMDGNDGVAPGIAEYLGNPEDQTGFHALDPVDLFNLMIIPGDEEVLETAYMSLWGPASIYCQSRRAFLLIDAPESWTNNARPKVVTNTALVNDLRATVVKDYSAVFYPSLKYNDNGLIKLIGPSGAIAGLMSRIDSSRGVWKAPAGVEADIRSILGLEVNLTDLENGVLNKIAVNCLRKFPSGFVNWGARTNFGSDDDTSEWKYIPIRRLALFIEESLYRGTKWVVFEPNDEPLWAKIRLNVNAFMMGLFRQGAFQGTLPDKAFYVKCDSETTTPADQNLGIVNIEVGFAPLKPAEFVVIKIQQIAREL